MKSYYFDLEITPAHPLNNISHGLLNKQDCEFEQIQFKADCEKVNHIEKVRLNRHAKLRGMRT